MPWAGWVHGPRAECLARLRDWSRRQTGWL